MKSIKKWLSVRLLFVLLIAPKPTPSRIMALFQMIVPLILGVTPGNFTHSSCFLYSSNELKKENGSFYADEMSIE